MPVIPPPLAVDADTAHGHAGPCCLCQRGILRGDRYALVVPTGKAAHVPCIGLAHMRVRKVPVIR